MMFHKLTWDNNVSARLTEYGWVSRAVGMSALLNKLYPCVDKDETCREELARLAARRLGAAVSVHPSTTQPFTGFGQ